MNKAMQAALVLAVMLAAAFSVTVVADNSDAAVIVDIEKPALPADLAEGTEICTVDGIGFTDFADAITSATESNKPIVLKTNYNCTIKTIDFIGDLEIDLNRYTLAINLIELTGNESITIYNGTLLGKLVENFLLATVSAEDNSSITFDDVDYYTAATGAIAYDNSSITVRNGTVIHAEGFGLGTNAGDPLGYDVKVTVTDSAVYADSDPTKAGTAILFNVPGLLTITGSTIQGYYQGVIVRGGNAIITGSTITNTLGAAVDVDNYEDKDWIDGNGVPTSALVIGNKAESAYQYPTSVSITDTVVVTDGANAGQAYTVAINANSGDGLGVDFAYDDQSSFTNEGKTEVASDITYDSSDDNISVGNPVAKIGDRGFATLQAAVAAVPTDGTEATITLLDNITLSDGVEIASNKNIILDMGGKTIDSVSNFAGRMIVNHGTLTITGNGTIDASDENKELNGPIDNYGTLIIENGTFEGNLVSNSALIWNRSGGTATFNDGNYSGSGTTIATEADSTTQINGGTYDSPWYPAFENRGEALITGGTFTNTSCSSCDSNHWGYTIRNGLNSDSAHLVIKPAEGSEVKVTGTQGGVTSVEGTIEIYGGSFTTVDCPKKHGQAFYALYVAGETGKTSATIYGGVFTSYNRTAVYVGNSGDGGIEEEAVVVIHGGTFSVTDTSDSTKYKGILYIDYETDNCPVAEVFGGSFSDSLPEDVIAPGYGVSNKGGQFVVDAITPEEAAASVETDGTTLYFETLADAIDYVPEGGTVTLVNDCETNPIVIDKGITLDLREHTVTINDNDVDMFGIRFTAGESLVRNGNITDSRSDGTTGYNYIAVRVSGNDTSVTTQGVNISTYEPGSLTNYNYGVMVDEGAAVTLNNGTSISEIGQTGKDLVWGTDTWGTVGLAVWGSSDENDPTSVTIQNGVSIVASSFAMCGNGTSHNTLMTINGGSLTSENAQAIYHPQKGTLNINGGVITGVTGVEIRSGTLNMTGGEVHGADEGFDAEANSNGSTTSAVGIAIVQHTTGNDIDVNITGGTITGYRALTEANTQKNDEPIENISISLSGGKFIGVNDDSTANSSVTAEDVTSFIEGGTYVLKDANNGETADTSLNNSNLIAEGFTVDSETGSVKSDSESPIIPPIDDDDDYVPIPPVVVDESSSDDTVTIVACAAAVVAAIMAVFLIIERRKG